MFDDLIASIPTRAGALRTDAEYWAALEAMIPSEAQRDQLTAALQARAAHRAELNQAYKRGK
jgi:hypothetical protein